MMNIKQSVLMVIGHPHSAGFPGLQAWPARPNSHFNLQMVYYWLLAHDEHVMYFIQKIVLCYYIFVLSGSISTFPTHLSAKHSPCLWAQSGVVAVKTFPENHRMSPIESSRWNWKLLSVNSHNFLIKVYLASHWIGSVLIREEAQEQDPMYAQAKKLLKH